MKSQTSPDITRAAERYLEQYGEPIVMNTYLKVTILVLAVVSLVLAGLVFKSQRALARHAPHDRAHQRRRPADAQPALRQRQRRRGRGGELEPRRS